MDMTFRQFAFKNVTRNKRLYAAYFLSSMFTVMVFFTFSIFAFHPVLNGSDFDSSVTQGMTISAGIIYVFSFFFILYSMSSFLQSRKKEFGLLMIQGMSIRQIRSMVFLENMLIGFFATIGGVLTGLIFAKLILLLADNILALEGALEFYLPTEAIALTFGSFIALFFSISLFVSYILRSKKLADLIKGNKKFKGEPKANIWLTLIAILLLGAGYTTALMAKGLMVVAVMAPVILAVTIGTYLLFTQISVFVINRLKNNKNIFWRNTNMILFSDLSFRMKDNARTFFMVAMVSTVAFSAIGTLYSFQSYIQEGPREGNPFTFTYSTTEDYEEEQVALINETLEQEGLDATSEQIIRYYYGEEQAFVISESDYNRFASLAEEDTIIVKDGEPVLAKMDAGSLFGYEADMRNIVQLESGEELQVARTIDTPVLTNLGPLYILSDNDHEQLPDPVEQTYIYSYHAWNPTVGEDKAKEITENLYSEGLEVWEFSSIDYQIQRFSQAFAAVLFVGLFIGIVFFVSAGSFLYFRLYSDLDDDKQKFKSIAKMGLTPKELSKVLNRQISILFFAPIAVALVHGAVALTALQNLFSYNLVKESVTVLAVFFLIQLGYFFIVRFFYSKQIKAEIY